MSKVIVTADTPVVWSFQPGLTASLVIVGGIYWWRLRELGRSGTGLARSDYLRAASFGAGLIVIALALMSPIDQLGEQRLFSVHMVQHLLIFDVAPILLLLGLSRPLMRPVVRRLRPLEQSLGYLAHPVVVLVLVVASIWVWHLPALYEAALDDPWVHQLEHLTFFSAGLAFWWFVIEPVPPRHRLQGMATIAYVAGAKVGLALLGVVLTFSTSTFYDRYVEAPRTWGLSPLDDQNVGGVLMMLEQSVVLASFFAILFARMLERSEQAQRRRERLEGWR
jgi:putative membrane protein